MCYVKLFMIYPKISQHLVFKLQGHYSVHHHLGQHRMEPFHNTVQFRHDLLANILFTCILKNCTVVHVNHLPADLASQMGDLNM